MIVLTAGTDGNVVRLLPPLVLERDLLDEALDVLGPGRNAGRREGVRSSQTPLDRARTRCALMTCLTRV